MKNYRIKITGKVHGVFYRAATVRMANKLGLSGWVKNESDGSVSISVDGEVENLNQLVKWCEDGPEYAKVNSVEFHEGKLEGENAFRIVR